MTEPFALPPIRDPVLVVGGYGYRNVGDEAMLAGLLRILDGRRVTVLSRAPIETSAMHGVRTVPLWQAPTQLRTHATLLIGGGALFGPDMGRLGRALPMYGRFARLAGRRLVAAGISIERGMPPVRERLARILLSGADWVQVRDQRSSEVLDAWGVGSALGADLSAALVPSRPAVGRGLLQAAGVNPHKPVVGLAVTAVNGPVGRQVGQAVIGLARRSSGVELCLIPMSQHPFVATHNDLIFCRSLQAAAPSLRILEGFHPPAAILSVFQSLSAAVCMRYHSFVFAERFGIPFVGYTYAPKVTAWLEERALTPSEPTANLLAAEIDRLLAARSLAS